MRAIYRLFYGKSIISDLHPKRNLKKPIPLQSTHQESRICPSKLHTMVCHRMKLYPVLNFYYNSEEEDGFQMVIVRAPPGAAESTAPGHIEWEKTIGSRVTVGEVVCRIRFKEDKTLDIKAPVIGVVAVRRKNEGDIVIHGDELFKIRLDALNGLKPKRKRISKKRKKDYYEEEEEIVGKAGKIDKSMKQEISNFKSPDTPSRPTEESNVPENKTEKPTTEEKVVVPTSPQEPQPHEPLRNPTDSYIRDNLQSQRSIIPSPYSQPTVAPIPQFMTTINEINMEDSVNFINKFAGVYEVKYGNKPCLRSMFLKSAAHCLRLHKELNIKLVNDERVESEDLEITIAIRHLKVIVFHPLKNIHKMSYLEISRHILKVEKEIAIGTYKTDKRERGFTVAPEWQIDSVVGTPAHSRTCTLGLHNIIKRPIFEEDKIVAYPMMYVSLTYDKKLIDDEKAIEYLKNLKESMEDPRHILVHCS